MNSACTFNVQIATRKQVKETHVSMIKQTALTLPRLHLFVETIRYGEKNYSPAKHLNECTDLVRDVAMHRGIQLSDAQIAVASLKLKNDTTSCLLEINVNRYEMKTPLGFFNLLDALIRNRGTYALWIKESLFEIAQKALKATLDTVVGKPM